MSLFVIVPLMAIAGLFFLAYKSSFSEKQISFVDLKVKNVIRAYLGAMLGLLAYTVYWIYILDSGFKVSNSLLKELESILVMVAVQIPLVIAIVTIFILPIVAVLARFCELSVLLIFCTVGTIGICLVATLSFTYTSWSCQSSFENCFFVAMRSYGVLILAVIFGFAACLGVPCVRKLKKHV